VTEIPGLYFLGLSWQHTRGSALLGWVGDDAEFIAGEMEAAAGPETATESTNYEHEGAPTPHAAGALEGV
jgi:putative flavoprotein involved in K+ transport